MLRHVSFVKRAVLEERIASIIRVTGIGELGTTLAVTSNRRYVRNLNCHSGLAGMIYNREVGVMRCCRNVLLFVSHRNAMMGRQLRDIYHCQQRRRGRGAQWTQYGSECIYETDVITIKDKQNLFWRMVSSGMLSRWGLVRPDVSDELADSCHPDEGCAKFLRNVGSYKSHTAYPPRRHHSS
jgi:hypothetical protein